MIETSVPVLAERPELRNTSDLLDERARLHPDHVAFQVNRGGAWQDVSTRAFTDEVIRLAKGLIGAGVGVGDAVAIMAATRYEWAVADFACWYAGAVVVPVYPTASVTQATAIVADAAPVVALVGGDAEREVMRTAHDHAEVATRGIFLMDAHPGEDLAALVALGTEVGDDVVTERRAIAGPDTVATIVYTSGTTRAAKGVLITHGNLVREALQVAAAYSSFVNEHANTIIFLPLSHILARALQVLAVGVGMRVAHLSDPTKVVATLAEIRPTFMVVVPRVLQKIQGAALAKAEEKRLGRVFQAAIATAITWGRHLEELDETGTPHAPILLRVRHAFFDRLFYAKLRALMGGRVEYLLSGAAALEAHLSLFFRGIGIPVIEGYGLTETTAPCTGNRPGSIRSGTVGIPIPGTTIRIAPDGEVLVKGVGVTPGYRNPEDNADAFVDGFFRTGDLGSLDERGRLTLSGRVKDIIVTSGGKNVVPAPWENVVEADPMVAYAVMVGEGKPFPAALILMAREELAAWAERHGRPALATLARDPLARTVDDPGIMAAIGTVVTRANQAVSRAEQVRKFRILLADIKEETGHLTPTLKLKRDAFLRDFHEFVEELYHGGKTHHGGTA
ncbi:MAG: long-chain fatty acid--CoA ligase [Actinomycetales bacterium]|nr:long-chain fatty acid--CoA ligase [Actinomycetales bacterium]